MRAGDAKIEMPSIHCFPVSDAIEGVLPPLWV